MNPDPSVLRRLAQQYRDMSLRARSDRVRQQLLVWAQEFETVAVTIEKEAKDNSATCC